MHTPSSLWHPGTLTRERETYKTNRRVLVDTSLHNSKSIAPAFRRQSDKHSNVSFYRVDICDQQDVAMDSGVKLAPTFRFFRDQKQVGEYVGSSPAELEVSLRARSAGRANMQAQQRVAFVQRKLAAFVANDKQ